MGGHTRLGVKRLAISDTGHYLACIFSVRWRASIRNESHSRMMLSTHESTDLRVHLARLAQRKIFFGHQSVGADVVRGLAVLAEELAVPLNIVETRRFAALDGPYFAHARIGRNGHAASKLDDFAQLLDDAPDSALDLAMAKLCYVDVTCDTDTGELARRHDDVFNDLARRHAQLRLVPVTVPLTTGFFGLRGAAAKLLGRPDPAVPDNRTRACYNDHLRTHHSDSAKLFDLAAIESNPSARRAREDDTPSLSPALTQDGGHLNRRGRRLAAIALVHTLGRLL